MRPTEERLEHVRYISENFQYLNGLVLVPSALALLWIGLLRWWMVFTDYTYTILFNAPLGVFILVMGILIYFQFRFTTKVRLYYAHTFGEVETSKKQKHRQSQIGWIVVVPMFIAFIFHFVFGVHNIFIASVIFTKGLESLLLSGPRLDAKLFGMSFILMSLVVFFIIPVDLFFYLDLVMGTALVTQGLMNHFYLRRHLRFSEQHG